MGRLDILLLGDKPKGEDGEDSVESADMACKAMFKAIQKNNYEGFKSALDDYLTYREEEKGSEGGDEMTDDD